MTQDSVSEELARILFEAQERMLPEGETWDALDEGDKAYYRNSVTAIAPRLRAEGMRMAVKGVCTPYYINALADALDPPPREGTTDMSHLGLLDDADHEAKYGGDEEYRRSELRIQALGAAISRRDWHAVETAYASIRDKFYSHARADALDPPVKP